MGVYGTVTRKPAKYSLEWMKGLTEKECDIERDIIWQGFCNPQYDADLRERFKNRLDFFDKMKSDIDWAGRKPQGPSYRREHGVNLYRPS